MNKSFIQEAFKQVYLTEDAEELSLDAINPDNTESFLDMVNDTEDEELISDVYDLEAEAKEDLKQSYIGKVILDCNVCHSNVFFNKEDITEDEDGLCCTEIECPYCMSNEGYTIIGEVKPYQEEEDVDLEDVETGEVPEEEVDIEIEAEEPEDEEELEEGLKADEVKELRGDEEINGADGLLKAVDKLEGSDEIRGPKYTELNEAKKQGTPWVVESDVDGEIARVKTEREAKATIAELKREDKKLRKGKKVKYSYKLDESLEECGDPEIMEESLVDTFLKYHDDADNANNPGFEKMYAILSKYGDETEPVDEIFLRAPEDEQKEMVSLITPAEKVEEGVEGTIGGKLAGKAVGTAIGGPVGGAVGSFVGGKIGDKIQDTFTKDESLVEGFIFELPEDASAEDFGLSQEEFEKQILSHDGKWINSLSEGNSASCWDITFDHGGNELKDIPEKYIIKVDKNRNRVNEGIEDVSINTDDENITMTTKEDGGVVVETSPKEDEVEEFSGEEMIAPIEPDTELDVEDAVEANSEDEEETPEEEFSDEDFDLEEPESDEDFEEFDEESFDNLGESYLKRCYENVTSFKTSNITLNENKEFVIEGKIGFDSGNKKDTQFIFKPKTSDNGKLKLEGYNKQISKGKKTFKLNCSINDKALVCESLNYNYKGKNDLNESVRVYGTVKRK